MKLPRDLSGQRVAKALRRLGFQVEHQEGSHLRLSNGARRVTIPLHSALLPKTLQSVLKQAGITIEELMRVL
jgi:predicted RNA binding protein YcfA (HicA-like mRNA interferase family)